MKNERKIREYLGDRYHLNVQYTENGEIKWKLFKKYNGWLYDNSEAIMTGDKSTEDDLIKFAKKHRDYNESLILSKSMIIIATINLFIAVANCFFKNVFLRGFVNGANFIVILISFIKIRISSKRLKVSELECKEALERLMKENK